MLLAKLSSGWSHVAGGRQPLSARRRWGSGRDLEEVRAQAMRASPPAECPMTLGHDPDGEASAGGPRGMFVADAIGADCAWPGWFPGGTPSCLKPVSNWKATQRSSAWRHFVDQTVLEWELDPIREDARLIARSWRPTPCSTPVPSSG